MTSEKRKEYLKAWQEANREHLREYQRKRYEYNKAYQKKYYEENKDKPEFKEKRQKYREKNIETIRKVNSDYGRNNRDKRTLWSLRYRAKRYGLDFNLELEDVTNYDTCPVFGWKLERKTGGQPNSPSVDKIIPELGYVKGNIQIISKKANTMKQDATPEELRMFARWVLKTFPEEQDGKH